MPRQVERVGCSLTKADSSPHSAIDIPLASRVGVHVDHGAAQPHGGYVVAMHDIMLGGPALEFDSSGGGSVLEEALRPTAPEGGEGLDLPNSFLIMGAAHPSA